MWVLLKPLLPASRSEKQSARTVEGSGGSSPASISQITMQDSKLIARHAVNDLGLAMVTEFIREHLFSTQEGEKWLQ